MGYFYILTMAIFKLKDSTKENIYYKIVETCLFNLIHVFCSIRVVVFNVVFVLGIYAKEPYAYRPSFFGCHMTTLSHKDYLFAKTPHVC